MQCSVPLSIGEDNKGTPFSSPSSSPPLAGSPYSGERGEEEEEQEGGGEACSRFGPMPTMVGGSGTVVRSCEITEEQLTEIVKRRISLVEANHVNGTTQQNIKDNMPFLLDVAKCTQRLNHKLMTKILVSQKTYLSQDEVKR